MSGHSHYSSIKYKKEISDKKRGQVFSKISRLISIAVKEGGSDPSANPKLRLAIEQAKKANMPKDNIERATQRGVGAIGKEQLEQVVFEAYGPGGIAIIVEGITDNKNRTLGEIRQILTQHNGKLAGGGSVKWLFERKGTIVVSGEQRPEEELEMQVIEAGAEDTYWHENLLDVYTKPEDLEKVKKNLEEKEIKIDSASLDWVAKEMIEVEEKEKQACQKLFEALDENDAVQDIYSNLKL